MEAIGLDWFYTLVIFTGWTIAMGLGAFVAWLIYERNEDE